MNAVNSGRARQFANAEDQASAMQAEAVGGAPAGPRSTRVAPRGSAEAPAAPPAGTAGTRCAHSLLSPAGHSPPAPPQPRQRRHIITPWLANGMQPLRPLSCAQHNTA